MAYGHDGKPSCCYQCTKRVVGCHAICPEHIKETQMKRAEKLAKKKFLHPVCSGYFRKPEYVSSKARQSKKRYR